jgi:hypothetical protein
MTVIKALLIYAAGVGLLVGGIAAGMDLPYDKALGMYAIGVVGVLSIAVPVLVVRLKPKRQARDDWQHLSADPVDRLPINRAVGEIVAPQQRQIEAPRREVEVVQ